METDTSVMLQSVVLPSTIEEPPAKLVRATKQEQKIISLGYSLNSNANFYDIPASDAFNDLIERYVPPQERPEQDIVPDKTTGLDMMVMNNMWRSIAKYARQQIVQSDSSQIELILKLWYMRLLALSKLGLNQLASAEFEKLGDLDRSELCHRTTHTSLVPFELRVLWASLPASLKQPAITLERTTMLAVYCKKMQKTDLNYIQLWEHRELQTYLILASHWIHIKDYSAAASTMELILSKVPNHIDVLSGLGRLYLQMGDLKNAQKVFEKMEAEYGQEKNSDMIEETLEMNRAFTLIARGEWSQARDLLAKVYESNNDNMLAMNNLAVCEVYLGNLAKAIEILETMATNNPTSAGVCETVIMNRCTLYELRYEDATDKKVQVIKQVARWAGDSFQADCIKLQ